MPQPITYTTDRIFPVLDRASGQVLIGLPGGHCLAIPVEALPQLREDLERIEEDLWDGCLVEHERLRPLPPVISCGGCDSEVSAPDWDVPLTVLIGEAKASGWTLRSSPMRWLCPKCAANPYAGVRR